MIFLGIKFAPINIPLARRLQTLATACWFILFVFGGPLGLFVAGFLLFTPLKWVVMLYLLWIFAIDKNTCERGGRRWEWPRSWFWLKYVKDYFPIKLERAPWVELDPKKNYLFCCFPHGILSIGAIASFTNHYGGFDSFFPSHTPYCLTLAQHFKMPFYRELHLFVGAVSASANSLKWILGGPETGKVAILTPGGAAESYHSRPGQYKLVLKNRKGFVKIALSTGAPLVPVLSFGETDLFDQPDYSVYPSLHKIQEMIRKVIRIAPLIPLGRGLFQYSFGLLPHRRPVTTIVGKPLEVDKIENPTQEQVDQVHKKFLQHLNNFFEEQKHRYVKDPDNTFLVIT